MTGFRNIAIHDYRKIDRDILNSILEKNLHDLEILYMEILRHFDFVS